MSSALPFPFFSDLFRFAPPKDFDWGFYLLHYDDLKHLRTRKQAIGHYLKHGKAEGRFPNEDAFLKHADSLAGLRNAFDVVAYRFFNKDLAQHFATEAEFFRHYVYHGHAEGRICSFDGDDDAPEALPDDEKWKSVFSMPEFLASCDDELQMAPASREEALRLFKEQGIDRLWPISFHHAFDPAFVRANGAMAGSSLRSDADLYRLWLEEGFPADIAPNEQAALVAYLGDRPFPSHFDWQSFARRAGLARNATRAQALVTLFDAQTRNVLEHADAMGEDAAWLLDRIGRRALAQGDAARALALLDRSIALAPTAEGLCQLGHAHRTLGDLARALQAYKTAHGMTGAPIEAFLQQADILATQREFDQLFIILRQAYPVWHHKAAFGKALEDAVRLFFEHRSAQAHEYYRQGARSRGDALLTETLDVIRMAYADMDRLPASTGGDQAGYVAILANDDLKQCTHYRVEQKALAFEQAGLPVKIFSHADIRGFMDSLIGARAAIFYRVSAIPPILRAIMHANAMGLETFYEVDDLIFDASCYPDPFETFEGQITRTEYAGLQFGVPLFHYALAQCSNAIASTSALAERMQAVCKGGKAFVIRNGLDARHDAAIRMGQQRPQRDSGRVRLFYGSGTKAHNADFNRLVAPVLIDLMHRHPQVDLVIVGHLTLATEMDALAARIITHPIIADLTDYWSVLAACDINLSVLAPGPVADCKSEIKWLEAAVLRIPSVVSATHAFREVIEDGSDGFLAQTPEQWGRTLEALVTQPDLRQMVGQKARSKALKSHDITMAAGVLRDLFVAEESTVLPSHSARLKVLVCNVFYAPQSYGGATRVVEDNVRAFRSNHPDLDISVFCSDEGALEAGRLTMDAQDGVPVYRLSVPQTADMNHIAFADDRAAAFERVLDHALPDLIHLHCIQHLTATILEVAQKRGIPTIVTMHDAWWISDHQFLVDRDGQMRLPGPDVIADAMAEPKVIRSLIRRQRLNSLLRSVDAKLTVSIPFAHIYAASGVDGMKVIENGLSNFAPLPHLRRQDGRVALGHIGGRNVYKGAVLVEGLLRRKAYRNLHLTMMDSSLSAGQTIETIWGTTPVTLISPCPQADVAQLYARIDVLLAPSTWPESFGLVTREALAHGIWVVASKLGAIGEDVEVGRNGLLIDTADTAQLHEALTSIDAAPETYRSSPPSVVRPPRGMADQAKELHKLYHTVASASR